MPLFNYLYTPLDVLLVNCKRVMLNVWHFTRFLLGNWEKLTICQARSFRYAQWWNWERFRKQILIKPYRHNTPYGRPKSVKKINHTYLIRSKQWTIFPKINWHYVWSIRERRVCSTFLIVDSFQSCGLLSHQLGPTPFWVLWNLKYIEIFVSS